MAYTITPSSGSISISQINGAFGYGNDLNSYRGKVWYNPVAKTNGTFSSGTISLFDFYSKWIVPLPQKYSFSGGQSGNFTMPAIATSLIVHVWGAGAPSSRNSGGGAFRQFNYYSTCRGYSNYIAPGTAVPYSVGNPGNPSSWNNKSVYQGGSPNGDYSGGGGGWCSAGGGISGGGPGGGYGGSRQPGNPASTPFGGGGGGNGHPGNGTGGNAFFGGGGGADNCSNWQAGNSVYGGGGQGPSTGISTHGGGGGSVPGGGGAAGRIDIYADMTPPFDATADQTRFGAPPNSNAPGQSQSWP